MNTERKKIIQHNIGQDVMLRIYKYIWFYLVNVHLIIIAMVNVRTIKLRIQRKLLRVKREREEEAPYARKLMQK